MTSAPASSGSSDTNLPAPPAYNRIGINYHDVPARKVPGYIIDAHNHTRSAQLTKTFIAAAEAYKVNRFWTQAPLEDVDELNAAFPGQFQFVATPAWQKGGPNEEFITDWMKRLDAFYEKGSRLVKFHQAPGTIKRWSMDLRHPLMRRVLEHAYELGYHFMTHICDPKCWFAEGARYCQASEYGTFSQQFERLDELLARYPDRIHLGAHMGGSMEDLEHLGRRLEKFPNYCIDTSATKWIVRAIAEQDRQQVRDFVLRFQDRILWGSDLVVGDNYNWDHYASRYWTHLKQWESDYQGPSPIADPDAKNQDPQLHGLDLPAEVLEKIYRANTLRWLPRADAEPAALKH